MSVIEVKHAMTDPSIFLESLGIKTTAAINIPCPGCGGNDRYSRYNDGSFYCRKAGNGDWITHAMHVLNITFQDVIKQAESFLGLDRATEQEMMAIKEKAMIEAEERANRENNRLKALALDLELKHYCDELILCINERIDEPSKSEKHAARKLYSAILRKYQK